MNLIILLSAAIFAAGLTRLFIRLDKIASDKRRFIKLLKIRNSLKSAYFQRYNILITDKNLKVLQDKF